MKTKNILYWFLPFLTSLLILSGCASDKNTLEELKKSVQLTLKFETGMETNLNKKGAANPIMIRVYELKNPSTFEQLDYFSLQDKDRVLLGNDLITKEEFIMRPEEQKIIVKTLSRDTEAIGFIAAYQDQSQSTWRKVYRLDRKDEYPLPKWALRKQKVKLSIDLYGYDMIIFDEEMNRL